VRAVVELGHLHRQQRLGGLGRLGAQVDPAAQHLAVECLADLLAVDRTGRLTADVGAVALGVAAYPSRDGDLTARRRGHVGRGRAAVVGGVPAAVDQDARAVGELQRDDDVDTGLALAGAVAHDHRVVDRVGPGRLDDAPLGGRRDVLARRHHLGDRIGAGLLVALDDRVAFLAVLEAVELPLTEAPRHPGQGDDDQCEDDPAARDQEPQLVHAARLSGTS
jgi:hypothetical protein